MEDNSAFSGAQIDVLENVYFVFLTPSFIGSFSVLVVSVVRWKRLSEQVHVLVQLALADLLAAATLMVTTFLSKYDAQKSVAFCPLGLPLALTFYLISSLLVLVYAWKSKCIIQGWRTRPTEERNDWSGSRQKKLNLLLYAMAWLVPIALYLPYASVVAKRSPPIDTLQSSRMWNVSNSSSTYCTSCVLFLHVSGNSCDVSERNRSVFVRVILIVTVLTVICFCSAIYNQIGKWYKQRQQWWLFPVEGDGRSGRKVKSTLQTARNMMIVILFCWVPVILLILLSQIEQITLHSLFPLYVIQAATVSLQGFLNSMVYAWRRPNFTVAVLGERTPLLGDQNLAFFEESLTDSK
ncbi:uncharacterized protein LOC142883870 [Nelusetta ayraudi]|uniref:uncharacterized protein LOC142883870 n=1 Tax=Nelusetta ayraudi TaxID=303726 RepID=UPI003F70DAFF